MTKQDKTMLHIGGEENSARSEAERASKHVLNLKSERPKEASINLKDEIKGQHEKAGRICIVGERSRERMGLSRLPMILAAFAIIVVLNFAQLIFLGHKKGNESLALASEAFTSLSDASHAIVSGDAGADAVLFEHAADLFQEARSKGEFLLGHNTPWITPPEQVQSFQNLIAAGEKMAELGEHIAALRVMLNTMPEEGSLTEFVRSLSEQHAEPAGVLLLEIDGLLDEVNLAGTAYEEKFYDYHQKLSALSDMFELWVDVKEPLLHAMGDRYVQHYMVVFMNDNEMRLGGGFMGSLALVEMNDGRMTGFEFQDVYDVGKQLQEDVPLPTHELKELIHTWELHDANSSAHFPKSAENIKWLYEKSGGRGVDGVIAVNLSAATELVKLMPQPITLPSLNQPLDADNFAHILSVLVEGKSVDAAQPKVIVGELVQVLLDSLNSPAQQLNVGKEILAQTHKKNINIYHDHASVQNLLVDLGMAGALPDLNTLSGDFVLPAFTNLGGNKADAFINTALIHDSTLLEDGVVDHSFTIRRANMFTPATLDWLKGLGAQYGFTAWNKDLEDIMGAEAAETGIRIYVPEGAMLTGTTGIHRDDLQYYFDQDLQHAYYYYRQTLAPGAIQEFTMHYQLPLGESEDYKAYEFTMLKQPGLKNVRFEKHFWSEVGRILGSEPLANVDNAKGYAFKSSLIGDMQIKLLLE